MKTILLSLAQWRSSDDARDLAIRIAQNFDGHIIGYYPIPGPAIMNLGMPGMDFNVEDPVRRLFLDRMPDIKSEFETSMKKENVPFDWRAERRMEPALHTAIAENGRESDLIVISQAEAGSRDAKDLISYIGNIVIGAGRPVLVVPPLNRELTNFDQISIGWNGSRESSRAVFDALPFLKKAKAVWITSVNPDENQTLPDQLPGSELAAALARHSVKAEVKELRNRIKVEDALTEHVVQDNVDLLVLGAYGHSRLREQIFGGVTDYVLRNMPCPVLFSN